MTTQELAKTLGLPESWVKSRMSLPRFAEYASWKTFPPESDLYRLCSVMVDIGESFKEPFYAKGDIIVQMNDDFAFIFDSNGNRK